MSADQVVATILPSLPALLDPRTRREAEERLGAAEALVAETAAVEAWRERPSAIAAPKHDPSFYDLVVIGSPVWAWLVSSPVRAYLTAMKPWLPDVAFFCTLGATESTRAWTRCGTSSAKRRALSA